MKTIVGVPSGAIREVKDCMFNELLERKIVTLDDEWTEDTPNGQYSYLDEDENKVYEVINKHLKPLMFGADDIENYSTEELIELENIIRDKYNETDKVDSLGDFAEIIRELTIREFNL